LELAAKFFEEELLSKAQLEFEVLLIRQSLLRDKVACLGAGARVAASSSIICLARFEGKKSIFLKSHN
jgi:hypothetical protein